MMWKNIIKSIKSKFSNFKYKNNYFYQDYDIIVTAFSATSDNNIIKSKIACMYALYYDITISN